MSTRPIIFCQPRTQGPLSSSLEKVPWSAYHLNGILGGFFWTYGTALFLTKKTERIEPYHLIRSFGCKCFPTQLSSKARIMKAKVKHKNRRPKLKSFLQLCCKKSVDSSRENKTTVTSRTVCNSNNNNNNKLYLHDYIEIW